MPIRVATWNMQGGINFPNVIQVLQAFNADIICLQETGNLADHMENRQNFGNPAIGITGNIRFGTHTGFCVYWPNGAETRLGTGIICFTGFQNHGIAAPVPAPRITPRYPRCIPWVEVQNPTNGQSIRIYSVHTPSAGPSVASNWNNAQIATIAGLSPHWALVGDFNADPDDGKTEQPALGTWVYSSNATQQRGNTLDYLISDIYAERRSASSALPMSDHIPQGFDIFL